MQRDVKIGQVLGRNMGRETKTDRHTDEMTNTS